MKILLAGLMAGLLLVQGSPAAAAGGVASWYCNSDPSRGPVSRCVAGHPDRRGPDLYAAVRKDLLYLRGKLVTVCADGCVTVRVIDCNCGPHANLIDLYADAFARIAPLSAGRVAVTMDQIRVSPPATDAVDGLSPKVTHCPRRWNLWV